MMFLVDLSALWMLQVRNEIGFWTETHRFPSFFWYNTQSEAQEEAIWWRREIPWLLWWPTSLVLNILTAHYTEKMIKTNSWAYTKREKVSGQCEYIYLYLLSWKYITLHLRSSYSDKKNIFWKKCIYSYQPWNSNILLYKLRDFLLSLFLMIVSKRLATLSETMQLHKFWYPCVYFNQLLFVSLL